MGSSASIPNTDVISIQGPMSPFIQEASLIKCAGSFSEQDKESLPVRVSRSDRKTYELRPENVRDTHKHISISGTFTQKFTESYSTTIFTSKMFLKKSKEKKRLCDFNHFAEANSRNFGSIELPGKEKTACKCRQT